MSGPERALAAVEDGALNPKRRLLLLGASSLPLAGCGFFQILAAITPKSNIIFVWQDERDQRVRVRGFKPAASSELFATMLVHDTGSGFQRQPSVAANKDGFVVGWVDTSNWSIQVKGFTLGGVARFGPVTVEATVPWESAPGGSSFPAYGPRIAMAADGSFVVCWDRGQSSVPGACRFQADGTHGAPFDVAPVAPTGFIGSDIAMADDGSFVVTYCSVGNFRTFLRGFNPNDTIKFGVAPIQVSSRLGSNALQQSVGITPDGTKIVVVQGCWQEPGNSDPVVAHGFDGNGISRFANVPMASSSVFRPGSDYFPSVALDVAGRFFVTWQDNRQGNNIIFARIFEADASPIVADFKVGSSPSGLQAFPVVGTNTKGEYVVVWQDNRSGQLENISRGFLGDSTQFGSEFTVNNVAAGQQRYPRVALARLP